MSDEVVDTWGGYRWGLGLADRPGAEKDLGGLVRRTLPKEPLGPIPPELRTDEEIERMGRWFEEHYDELVTALQGIRNFWQSDEVTKMTQLFKTMEEMRREQVNHWNGLILGAMEAYEGEEVEEE